LVLTDSLASVGTQNEQRQLWGLKLLASHKERLTVQATNIRTTFTVELHGPRAHIGAHSVRGCWKRVQRLEHLTEHSAFCPHIALVLLFEAIRFETINDNAGFAWIAHGGSQGTLPNLLLN